MRPLIDSLSKGIVHHFLGFEKGQSLWVVVDNLFGLHLVEPLSEIEFVFLVRSAGVGRYKPAGVCVRVYVCICACVCVCVRMCAYVCVCVCMYVYDVEDTKLNATNNPDRGDKERRTATVASILINHLHTKIPINYLTAIF